MMDFGGQKAGNSTVCKSLGNDGFAMSVIITS